VVLDDLVAGLEELPGIVRARWPLKAWAVPVVLGCTPWFSSDRVVDALLPLATCIVIDKGRIRPAVRRLMAGADDDGTAGVPLSWLGLDEWGPLDASGDPPVIGPWGPLPGTETNVGPVRMLGFRGNRKPLLHAKLAVACAGWRWEGEFGEELELLTPLRVWAGSANWTEGASDHLEFGMWSDDEAICKTALAFMRSVITASEGVTSEAPGPLPDLAAGVWDDDAFRDYLAEHRDAYDPDDEEIG
jgi:hypothetical protein